MTIVSLLYHQYYFQIESERINNSLYQPVCVFIIQEKCIQKRERVSVIRTIVSCI